MVKAINEKFVHTTVLYCLFHLGQSVNRRLERISLYLRYQQDPEIKLQVNMLLSLCYVPVCIVTCRPSISTVGKSTLDKIIFLVKQLQLTHIKKVFMALWLMKGLREELRPL